MAFLNHISISFQFLFWFVVMNSLPLFPSVDLSGFESVGSPDLRKTDEAKRSHRQRQVVVAESGRHPGESKYMKYAWVAAINRFLSLSPFAWSPVPVGQL